MNNTITHTISDSQMSQLNELAHKLNRLGLNLFVLDSAGTAVLQMQADQLDSDLDQIKQGMHFAADADLKPYWATENRLIYPIRENDTLFLTLAVDAPVVEQTTSQHEKDYLLCIVEDFVHQFSTGDKILAQIDKIGNELSKAYEEIMLMYNLSTNMKVTQSSSSYLQMACDQLTQLVQVEGIAIFVDRTIDKRKQLALSAGSGVISIDPSQADILQMNLASELHDGKEALLDSSEDGPFKYVWPKAVKNLIAVPLGSEERMAGFLVATNVQDKADFDTTDIKLFNSVANQCMVFIENNRLFDELKELFIGSLKALTNSIDAKDQYTRGHSERVAFISRWIAEHLAKTQPITEDEIHKIYLAGLLHDIGKIGVNESVLRKQGRLTDEEHKSIQTHPGIGGSIL